MLCVLGGLCIQSPVGAYNHSAKALTTPRRRPHREMIRATRLKKSAGKRHDDSSQNGQISCNAHTQSYRGKRKSALE